MKEQELDIQAQEEGRVDETEAAGKLVPVTESIRYRKRAQVAEKKLGELQQQLDETRRQADGFAKKLESIDQDNQLAIRLSEAGAMDIESAVLLAGARMKADSGLDIDSVVNSLRQEKGYLFESADHKPVRQSKTASARDERQALGSSLERAAGRAAASGNRVDLLEYLKLRRKF